ncbi:unnamed protein product [Schistosoma margrebowiei]|uniref:Uncharacterized protein n=1 Tax=Schistosoma margrebowiei TaxID=48269 RepID=A0A183LT53_9TREM|nr:unnamed protein product [Schistosoma margrebowiei]
MRTSTSEGRHGIQWTAGMQIDDLEFADDLALISHSHQEMQMKTTSAAADSSSIGLNTHEGKSSILKYNMENTNTITLDREDVETFTYLVSIIDE